MCVCIRYQLFLQLKQDVLRGRLPVNFDLAAELAAYVLQCESPHINYYLHYNVHYIFIYNIMSWEARTSRSF